ncbi:MAG: helix-turn-helix transcriptional regulator [Bacteroidales bacterium]|nr:helix-turn-helix transcriptional regulator [Bacteroidales bacterium]
MNRQILNIESIQEYERILNVGPRHPLVSVIDLDSSQPMRHLRHTFGFYAIFLKDEKNCELLYGRQKYDYTKGSVVCLAPGQVIGIEDNGETFQPHGWALLFHPDLIKGSPLATRMREYSYFSYEVNEALHVSDAERELIVDCLRKISMELDNGDDRLSRRLITTNIELLLDYCLRFYQRQFASREKSNKDILVRFERLLDEYFASEKQLENGFPTVNWCAAKLCLSPNYFGDLMKKETGKTAQEHIRMKLIDLAKDMLLNPSLSISQISFNLGFQYPQHFTRLFKKTVGMTPNQYRQRE